MFESEGSNGNYRGLLWYFWSHFKWGHPFRLVAQLIQNLEQSSIVARWSPVLPVISVFDLGDTTLHGEPQHPWVPCHLPSAIDSMERIFSFVIYPLPGRVDWGEWSMTEGFSRGFSLQKDNRAETQKTGVLLSKEVMSAARWSPSKWISTKRCEQSLGGIPWRLPWRVNFSQRAPQLPQQAVPTTP